MLVSHSRRLVFIHVQKTGGEAIWRLLADQVDDLERIGAKHATVRDVRGIIEPWTSYYRFAFVRNPWDRLVSWWSMIEEASHLTRIDALRDGRRRRHRRQVTTNPVWQYALGSASSFDQFVRHCTAPVNAGPGCTTSFARNQVDYLRDEHGRVSVDFVGRFESFTSDLARVFDDVGLQRPPAHRENQSRHGHYSPYYNAETRELIAHRFADDVAAFGYSFEGPSEAPPVPPRAHIDPRSLA